MSFDPSRLFAKLVAMIGASAILMRRFQGSAHDPVVGSTPQIPPAKAQGIPTLKMPTAKGWSNGHTPTAVPGLSSMLFTAQ